MTAAQLFEAAKKARPGILAAIEKGDLSELDAWLTENVWGVGCLLEAHELVERATGAPLGTGSLERHRRRRYLGEG